MKKLLLLIAFAIVVNITNAQWQQTNGPYGGDITCMAVNGTNIFAGTYYDGIFLSSDNGSNWSAIDNGLSGDSVLTLLVVDGTNIFAGMKHDGVFLSNNNGASWTAANNGLPSGSFVGSLVAVGTNIFAGTNNGVFLSTNNGMSWTPVNNGLAGDTSIVTLAVSGTNIFASAYEGGVFVSTNNGINWTSIKSGLPENAIRSLAANGTNVFAGSYDGGAFLSVDTGKTWVAINKGITSSTIVSFAFSGRNILAAYSAFGVEAGVYLSTDTGKNWTIVNNGLTNFGQYVNSLVCSGPNVFAGTANGMFLSTDTAANWTQVINGFSNTNVISLQGYGTNIFAGTDLQGVYLSTDSGQSWKAINNGLPPNSEVSSFATNGTTIFVGLEGGGVALSNNYGTNWTEIDSGLSTEFDVQVISLAISGTNLLAGTWGGTFLSTDTGASWNIDPGFPNNPAGSFATSGANLFAGTSAGIFLSTDNGVTWRNASYRNGLTCDTVTPLAAIGTNIFAGTLLKGVFLSTDVGGSWRAVNNGLIGTNIHALVVSGTNIFAATDYGVFLSTNNGESWTSVNNNLANTHVLSLGINGANIYAGTLGSGVWKRALSDILPHCASNFSIDADTSQLHHYIVTDNSFGEQPLKYVWNWGDGSPNDSIAYPSHTYADSGFYDICLSITDSSGCTSSYCDSSFHAMRVMRTNTMIYVNVFDPLITGTKALNLEASKINIYPNPATNQLTIQAPSFHNEPVTVSIMNMLGQEASPPTPLHMERGGAVIDVSRLSAGMYFVQLKSESGSVVKKFVKE